MNQPAAAAKLAMHTGEVHRLVERCPNKVMQCQS